MFLHYNIYTRLCIHYYLLNICITLRSESMRLYTKNIIIYYPYNIYSKT